MPSIGSLSVSRDVPDADTFTAAVTFRLDW